MVAHSPKSKRRKTAAHETCPREQVLFDVDLLASIAPYLAAVDLANLSLTCRHFGVGTRGENGDESLENDNDASLSLGHEAARRAILNEQSDAERAALVRYPGESWIALYHQLLMLRSPLIFDVLVGKYIEYEDGDKSLVIVSQEEEEQGVLNPRSAISKHIMSGGKHYVEFSVAQGDLVRAGLMRPIPSGCWEKLGKLDSFHPASLRGEGRVEILCEMQLEILKGRRSERRGASNIDCCIYNFYSGHCACCNWEEDQVKSHSWEGQERIRSGVLGLLLDVDAGTLTAYKDGRRLGVMREGLGGDYCWVASISGVGGISIKRGAIPDDA